MSTDHDDTIEASWAPVARAAREALELLGYGELPRCLPGEPDADACGEDCASHAGAFLSTLIGVANHQLRHLEFPPGLMAAMINRVEAELSRPGHNGGGGVCHV